jgi:hypothetical protein
MKGTFTVIKADGNSATQPVVVTPKYEMIKDGLNGGWLELVPLFDRYKGERCVVFCDEEGRLNGLPRNPIATALWHACIRARGLDPMRVLTPPDAIDGLVGPIVIISCDEELLRDV